VNINRIKNFIICLVKFRSIRLFICCDVAARKIYRKHVLFPHPIGIVIPANCTVGHNCTIYQNVTIGAKNGKYPVIGNNCILYPNTCIIGDIVIGDNCVIGAGSVVLTNIPPGSVAAGNPAKVIK